MYTPKVRQLWFFLGGEILLYVTNEKPGVGTYMCMMCRLELIIEADNEELPRCPDCDGGIYKKVD